ncbi:MAG TPA: HEAT repeat domain-containing protein [Bacteroidales bacterium]|nr:HEAT repeat domain-containing protein [Bacteroidales bacterium]
MAKEKYPGNTEDALIAFLLDTTNTYHDRSHVAVWTLGQIKSGKALPLIRQLYKDDPSGVTCHKRHDEVICQRVLHNAIVAIESDRELYSGLNK